ncbi:MAG: restriction endonuclease subunit S [Flavobacterium sp.]|jgi:type I restriction enzyme S subunit|uniref:Restriction endonuclease subunit S n=1 Tax=Flavobacterium caseinilyticum TaxID=2541732 RepID=A0A4R5ARX2_9FLAO|nr:MULTISPECIES: restriction endonuclease subunit S [Flavobacterium]MDD2822224.1 restriction endonuclease subunit S [Flavobacterium sp.]PIF62840.1 type I restriction enzyme S subunit [Flavobacterium sp. 11]TDD73854.1 restriction endonuclease subunit S [Flavobacterium caseinilyticum]
MEIVQPKLRFPEFKGDWNKKLIKEVLSIGSGRDYKHLEKGNVPVFGTGGLMNYVNDFLYDGETVCIGRKGTIDKPMYFDGKIWTVDTLFYTNKFINSTPKFIYNLFQRINWKEYNEASGVPSLSKSTIEKIEIKLPLIEEQTRIANFLSSVDEKLNLLKEKKALLEDYKKGIMQKIFNQEIRFKDDNGEDFEDWEEKSIGNILTIGSGRDYKHLNYGNVPVFGTGGLMTFVDSFLHQGETVCIGRKGTIDKPMYYNGDIWTVDTLFYTHTFIESIPKFVYYVFQSINWKQHNEASGVPSLSKSTIEQILINVPSVAEQTKIANFLSAIDEKIALVSNQIQDTQEYKKGLLQQMFV